MHKQIKKYLRLSGRQVSFVFLFLLLFPIVEKGIHALEHHNINHCTITDKHFHQQEHTCSICNFTITGPNSLPSSDAVLIISTGNFLFQPFTPSANISFAFSNLPSRAPPIA